jgi:hypothetical protein
MDKMDRREFFRKTGAGLLWTISAEMDARLLETKAWKSGEILGL